MAVCPTGENSSVLGNLFIFGSFLHDIIGWFGTDDTEISRLTSNTLKLVCSHVMSSMRHAPCAMQSQALPLE